MAGQSIEKMGANRGEWGGVEDDAGTLPTFSSPSYCFPPFFHALTHPSPVSPCYREHTCWSHFGGRLAAKPIEVSFLVFTLSVTREGG